MILTVIYISRSVGPFTRTKSATPRLQERRKRHPFIVLYVDEVCLKHENLPIEVSSF